MASYKSTLTSRARTLYEYTARPGSTCSQCAQPIPENTPLFWQPPPFKRSPSKSYCPQCARRLIADDLLAQHERKQEKRAIRQANAALAATIIDRAITPR